MLSSTRFNNELSSEQTFPRPLPPHDNGRSDDEIAQAAQRPLGRPVTRPIGATWQCTFVGIRPKSALNDFAAARASGFRNSDELAQQRRMRLCLEPSRILRYARIGLGRETLQRRQLSFLLGPLAVRAFLVIGHFASSEHLELFARKDHPNQLYGTPLAKRRRRKRRKTPSCDAELPLGLLDARIKMKRRSNPGAIPRR